MICPNCYTRIKRGEKKCRKCGFDPKEVKTGSNQLYKQAGKLGRLDEVMFTSAVPNDISKKKMLLLSIFAGYTGAHQFYVGRNKLGAYYLICFILFFFELIVLAPLGLENKAIVLLSSMIRFASGIALLMWVADIAKVATNTFKYPILLEEKDEKPDYKVKKEFTKETKTQNSEVEEIQEKDIQIQDKKD